MELMILMDGSDGLVVHGAMEVQLAVLALVRLG